MAEQFKSANIKVYPSSHRLAIFDASSYTTSDDNIRQLIDNVVDNDKFIIDGFEMVKNGLNYTLQPGRCVITREGKKFIVELQSPYEISDSVNLKGIEIGVYKTNSFFASLFETTVTPQPSPWELAVEQIKFTPTQDYETFTNTDDYVGYYVKDYIAPPNYVIRLVTNDNKDTLGIVPGTTETMLGEFYQPQQSLIKYNSAENEILIKKYSESGLQKSNSLLLTKFQDFIEKDFILDDLTISAPQLSGEDTMLEINYIDGKHLSLDLSKTSTSTSQQYSTLNIINKGFLPNIEDIVELKIPKCITEIKQGALSGAANLTKLIIPFVGGKLSPNSDTEEHLFGYIFGETDPDDNRFFETVQYFKTNASKTYYIPKSLNSVTVLDGYLYYGAFYNCGKIDSGNSINLQTIKLNHLLDNKIHSHAFYNCKKLQNILISFDLTEIGYLAFYQCYALRTINLPRTLTTIGEKSFNECHYLSSITIPESVTSIGDLAFAGCLRLKTINFNAMSCNHFTNNSYVFNKVGEQTSDGVDINIGDEVGRIPAYLLSDSIDSQMHTKIKTLKIGKKVNNIGTHCFDNLTNLTNIIYNAPNCRIMPQNDGIFIYAGVDGAGVDVTIGEDVEYLPPLFRVSNPSYSPKIRDIQIGTNVTLVGSFKNCTSISSIILPNSVTEIATEAFMGCVGLQSIKLSNNMTQISSLAFKDCSSLFSVEFKNIEGIDYNAFENCVSLRVLNLPLTLRYIDNSAFKGCSNLIYVTFPPSTTYLGIGAFENCSSINNIIVYGDIYSRAFKNCVNLESVSMLGGTMITNSAFEGCKKLNRINLSTELTYIGDNAFKDCSLLICITIPENVTQIGSDAFKNCVRLNTVFIDSLAIYFDYNDVSDINSICGGLIVYADAISVRADKYYDIIGNYLYENSTTSNSGTTYQYKRATNIFKASLGFIADYVSFLKIYNESLYNGVLSFSYDSSYYAHVYEASKDITSPITNPIKIPTVVRRASNNGLYVVYAIKGRPAQGSSSEAGFAECLNIEEIIFPATIDFIPSFVFWGCDKLYRMFLYHTRILHIGSEAFSYLPYLPSIILPNTLKHFYTTDTRGYGAFTWCSNLQSTTIPPKIEPVKDRCFYASPHLVEVINDSDINMGVKSGTSGLGDCTKYAQFVINKEFSTYYTSRIINLNNVSYYLTYDNKLVANGIIVYENFNSHISIDNLCNRISSECFRSLPIQSITIPSSVTSIGSAAFEWCSELTSIVIGENVKNIEYGAFNECDALTSVYYYGTEEQWNTITIGSYNSALRGATRYYYSETQPTTSGNYWHYVNGIPTPW